MKTVLNHKFAYVIGNFMADGSFYKDTSGFRFEFCDGSQYINEVKYSKEHISNLKEILERFLNRKLPNIRKIGNMYRLSFRDKNLAILFLNTFKLSPGKKAYTIDIPDAYLNTKYEISFWQGYMDGDGSIARKSKKVSVESMSFKIINSLCDYLNRNKIYFSTYKTKRKNGFSYVLVIRSISFREFAKRLGFKHPLKLKLLKKKLNNRDFFVVNKLSNKISVNEIIDYEKIFSKTIFLENGKELLKRYNQKMHKRDNIPLYKVIIVLKKLGLSKKEILKMINNYKFKKSKGSTNSVKLPLALDKKIIRLAKFVRIRDGGITFSKSYISSFNENFNDIISTTKNIFQIEPTYTCKKEPLFCSGVLSEFFSYIVKNDKNDRLR